MTTVKKAAASNFTPAGKKPGKISCHFSVRDHMSVFYLKSGYQVGRGYVFPQYKDAVSFCGLTVFILKGHKSIFRFFN